MAMALKKVQKMKVRKRWNTENLKNKSEEFADTVSTFRLRRRTRGLLAKVQRI